MPKLSQGLFCILLLYPALLLFLYYHCIILHFITTLNLPGCLFARATINFSVFTRVMNSLSVIYYEYASYYLILLFLFMKYAVIEWICKIFVIIYDYLQAKLRVG